MPQGSVKKSKCDVPKQKDKHTRKLTVLKKGGIVFKCFYSSAIKYCTILSLKKSEACGQIHRLS